MVIHWCTYQSGYNVLELLDDFQPPLPNSLPLNEIILWGSNIWNIKASSKLKHFLWHTLSGALAVSERIQTHGIQMDTTSNSCGFARESICHVLFHCQTAKETWEPSNISIFECGLSPNSLLERLSSLCLQ